jgi:nickel-type superoxide dismutase maturation protease
MLGGGIKPRRWPILAPLFRVRVAGDSMLPAVRDGDRVLVRRTRQVRPGDIVVAVDPRDGSRPLVKRVAAVSADGVTLLGDNPAASTDSRAFGPLAPHMVKGRAVYRYAPSDRAGKL